MIGHGRPTPRLLPVVCRLATIVGLLCALPARAAEIDVRLRFAWGSGPQAPQKWFGAISAPECTLTALQPLGLEADEVAALRLVDGAVRVSPIVPRAFDGCDVTLRGDEAAVVTIALDNPSAPDGKDVQISLGELAAEQLRAPLDDLGGYLIVERFPGDALRVAIDRKHLVLAPGEPLVVAVTPHRAGETNIAGLTVEGSLRAARGGPVVWELVQPFDPAAATVNFEVPAPAAEGAYRLTFALRRPQGLTSKLTPWQNQAALAARDVEFAVVDPGALLPRITAKWEVVQTIDPTSSKWWQRVPEWTQLDRLPVLTTPRALGNVKPRVHTAGPHGVVELPTAAPGPGVDPSWQAYPLAIREPGQPHVLEVELPAGTRQHLAVSIIEPDAAGRVLTFGREAGVYVDGGLMAADAAEGPTLVHRVLFWPRTQSPLVLLANHSGSQPAEYGTIRVWRRGVAPAAIAPGAAPAPQERLVAAYVSLPRFYDALGAADELDGPSGMSVEGWATFLDAAGRLTQELRAGGYNAAVVSIAADGGSLAPIDALGGSPRYDTGVLSSSGADPFRKDVLEALLRVFDREGLRLIPAIDLATPLPALESLREGADPRAAGLVCIGRDGRSWSEHFPDAAAGAHYNLLNPRVQSEIAAVVDQLLERYQGHPALAGVAVQASGRGYAVLPGLSWSLDDATAAHFSAETQVILPAGGEDRFLRREQLLTGPERAQWIAWRQRQVAGFYGRLAARVAESGAADNAPARTLVLCTEDLFAGDAAAWQLRRAVGGRATVDDATRELGIDFEALAAVPHLCLLRPRRLASDGDLQARATELVVNGSVEFDHVLTSTPQAGELLFHSARRLRLASFDQQSPFGAAQTYAAFNLPSYPAGASARRPLATALANRDFYALVEGAETGPLAQSDDAARLRRLFRELPDATAEVRVERSQPVTLRMYRTAQGTTLCLVNESAWPVELTLPLAVGEPAPWRELGHDPAGEAAEDAAGTLALAGDAWKVVLPAYGLAARRYQTRTLRVGPLAPSVSAQAKAALSARIEEIEQRMQGLDVKRPYPQLQNADFEIVGEDGRMMGWQPRIGERGAVAIAKPPGSTGGCLHLRSEDVLGVAAQSLLFPMPGTGQLAIRAKVRVRNMAPEARVYVWIECHAPEPLPLRYVPLEGELAGDWVTCEVAFDDLPLASSGQMKVQFHLAGTGEAWIDEVELFDLRFANAHRKELGKRLYAARNALEQGWIVDCQRLVDSYWPRYLVEYLPPAAGSRVSVATLPQSAAPPKPEPASESPRMTDRVRESLPRLWK